MMNASQRNNQHSQRVTDVMERHGFVGKRRVWIRDATGNKQQLKCWVKEMILADSVVDWELPDFLKTGKEDPGM
jgi:hypothetical protein